MADNLPAETNEIYALYHGRLRAEEIDFVSREEYRYEFQKQMKAASEKVKDELENGLRDLDRNLKIDLSVVKNKQRIEVLKAQRKTLDGFVEKVRNKLNEYVKSGEYYQFLVNLFHQTLSIISEKDVVIRCVKRDDNLIDKLIDQVKSKYPDVSIARSNVSMPDSAIGGLLLHNKDETINVDNTLEARLRLASEGCLPQISRLLGSK